MTNGMVPTLIVVDEHFEIARNPLGKKLLAAATENICVAGTATVEFPMSYPDLVAMTKIWDALVVEPEPIERQLRFHEQPRPTGKRRNKQDRWR